MSQPPVTSAERFAAVVETFRTHTNVTFGSQGKKGFGASALKINGKIFAMLDNKGQFVVKLSRQRVDELIATGQGERFDPGHGRVMKEWIAIKPSSEESWLSLAKEAMGFVIATQ